METIQKLKELLASAEAMEQSLRRLIEELEREAAGDGENNLPGNFEEVYPLSISPSSFKRRRPVRVLFPDGTQMATPTWKKVVEVLMKRCNQDPRRHEALMALRNRIQGRDRILLGSSVTGMRSPLVIDNGLYMETHYDTETLLRIATERILKAVGYDYGAVQVAVRSQ